MALSVPLHLPRRDTGEPTFPAELAVAAAAVALGVLIAFVTATGNESNEAGAPVSGSELARTGISATIRVPLPGLLSTAKLPPVASTRSRRP